MHQVRCRSTIGPDTPSSASYKAYIIWIGNDASGDERLGGAYMRTERSDAAILVSQRFPPAFELFTDFWKGAADG